MKQDYDDMETAVWHNVLASLDYSAYDLFGWNAVTHAVDNGILYAVEDVLSYQQDIINEIEDRLG